LFVPILFSAMAIAYLVLWAVVRRKRQLTIRNAVERPDPNTLDRNHT
jgi:hypothetical protein